jgi:hypothetical protein
MKSRKFRKKDESDSSDNDISKSSSERRPDLKAVSKKPKSTIGFNFDDEIDEDSGFQVKKTKESKLIKKTMKQAPGIHLSVQEDLPNSYATSYGGEYSAESLQQLRKSQIFKNPLVQEEKLLETIEVMELSGDAAESLELLQSVSEENSINTSTTSMVNTTQRPSETLPDYIPLNRNRKVRDKMSTDYEADMHLPTQNSESFHHSAVDEDIDDEGEKLWEENIKKRAGLTSNKNTSSTKSNKPFSGYYKSNDYETTSSARGAGSAGLGNTTSATSSIDGIKAMLVKGIETYQSQCLKAENHLNQLKGNNKFNTNEEMKLTSEISQKSDKLKVLQVEAIK